MIVRNTLLLAIALTAWNQSQAQPVPENDDPLSKAIVARRKLFETVRFTIEGERVDLKGAKPDPRTGKPSDPPNPPTDLVTPSREVLLLDLVGQRYRRELWEARLFGSTQLSHSVHTFDGTKMWGHGADEKSENAFVSTGDLRAYPVDSNRLPPYLSCGILRRTGDEIYPGHLAREFNSDFYFQRNTVFHMGTNCTIYRSRPKESLNRIYQDYWIDLSTGTVRRYVDYSNNEIILQIDLDYRKLDQVLVLDRWDLAFYLLKKAIFYEKYHVKKIDRPVQLADGDFAVTVRPGMVFVETHHPLSKAVDYSSDETKNTTTQVYSVEEGGKKTEIHDKQVINRMTGGTGSQAKPRTARSPIILVGCVIVSLSLIATLAYRVWRARRVNTSP